MTTLIEAERHEYQRCVHFTPGRGIREAAPNFFSLSDVLCDEKLKIPYGCTLNIGFNPLVHCLDFLVCLCLCLAFGKEILK